MRPRLPRRPAPARRRAAALALGLALLAGCRGVYEKHQEIDEDRQLEIYVTTATYLYEDGSLLRAQDQAVKALEIDPKNRPMRRMIGWIRLRQGKNEDVIIAEQFFRMLVREGDASTATLLGLATATERLGFAYDAASKAYASGERESEDSRSAEDHARELARRARDLWNESLELFERTLSDGEGSTSAMNGLQRVHALLGQYDESLSWSDALLERSSAELETWSRMLTGAELTDSEERMFKTNAESAIRLQVDTHLFAATILALLERWDDAVAHLDAAIGLQPDVAEMYSRRAQLRAHAGRCQQAIEDVDAFLRMSDKPFDHPDVQRAFDLRKECEAELQG